jgi:hypothetical protein
VAADDAWHGQTTPFLAGSRIGPRENLGCETPGAVYDEALAAQEPRRHPGIGE